MQKLSTNQQLDHILLPLLIQYKPMNMLVCGQKEDELLRAMSQINPAKLRDLDFRPPQLSRLSMHEFYLPICLRRITEVARKKSFDNEGNLYSRSIIPSECTMGVRAVGALLGYLEKMGQDLPEYYQTLELRYVWF